MHHQIFGHQQLTMAPPNNWQIKIDGVIQRDLLFSSLRVAVDRAKELIDQERSAD